MAPIPKHPKDRARRNIDKIQTTSLRFEHAAQPKLPTGYEWCRRTRAWWKVWGSSPQAEHFSATDWDALLDTAYVHQALWGEGRVSAAGELRQRLAAFGATPADRARLRMSFAEADEADAKRTPPPGGSAKERFAGLRVLGS